MTHPSRPRSDVVDEYRRIANLAAWCERRLAEIHQERYSHLADREFWPVFALTVNQWAADESRPATDRAHVHTHDRVRWWQRVTYDAPYRRRSA